ncbi:hypothetical protein D3C83_288230 [compost metagenome]
MEPELEKQIRNLTQRLASNAESLAGLKTREAHIRADFEDELVRYRRLVSENNDQEG